MGEDFSSELIMILEMYDLGELVDFQRDVRGTVNTSFTIEMLKDGARRKYFLRRYKDGIRSDEVRCEHSMIRRLKSQGFDIVAGAMPTRDGGTYVLVKEETDGQNGVFYAIFDFLTGEDRYTWVGPVCSPAEIASSASVLAEFHQALSGFVPEGSRMEPGILQLLPQIEANLRACAARPRGTVFDSYLQEHLAAILDNLHRTRLALESTHDDRCPRVVIHCDYHPGNLKFEAERVVGVFDLDWSKVDYRCFDVALAAFYFFVSWEEDQDGQLRLDDLQRFLEAYQARLKGTLDPGPLTAEELRCLPAMIAAANLYVLNWTILDFLRKDVDPHEYLVYLQHAARTIRWLDDSAHRSALLELLRGVSVDSHSASSNSTNPGEI